MEDDLKICIIVDDSIIYEFSGKLDEQIMINSANDIEELLIEKGSARDKVQNVFELFVETIQNILNYSHNSIELQNNKKEVFCDFSLSYFTKDDTYILASCNLIEENQQEVIAEKVSLLNSLDDKALRKLVRQKSRSREDSHYKGAGLGYIVMARKSSAPIEVLFTPYKKGILKYKQKLFI